MSKTGVGSPPGSAHVNFHLKPLSSVLPEVKKRIPVHHQEDKENILNKKPKAFAPFTGIDKGFSREVRGFKIEQKPDSKPLDCLDHCFWKQVQTLKEQLDDQFPRTKHHPNEDLQESDASRYLLIQRLQEDLDSTETSLQMNPCHRKKIISSSSRENVIFKEKKGFMAKDKELIHVQLTSQRYLKFKHLVQRIIRLLRENVFARKRELFYEDVKLYEEKDNICYRLIDDICCHYRTRRVSLHILSSDHSCIIGDLFWKNFNDNEQYDCFRKRSVPDDPSNIKEMKTKSAKFLLVVESDSIFTKLVELNTHKKFKCILVTGKGVPDVNTRHMVKLIWTLLRIPVFGLFDGNPFGISIMIYYRFGSFPMSYDYEHLATPALKWIGIKASDFQRFNLTEDQKQHLKDVDITRIDSLLNLSMKYFSENNWNLRREFDQQLRLFKDHKYKIELEALSSVRSDFLLQYLEQVIRDQQFL